MESQGFEEVAGFLQRLVRRGLNAGPSNDIQVGEVAEEKWGLRYMGFGRREDLELRLEVLDSYLG